MSGYERENRNVLRRCLKTASDGAAVTWAGRSFHTAAPHGFPSRLQFKLLYRLDIWTSSLRTTSIATTQPVSKASSLYSVIRTRSNSNCQSQQSFFNNPAFSLRSLY